MKVVRGLELALTERSTWRRRQCPTFRDCVEDARGPLPPRSYDIYLPANKPIFRNIFMEWWGWSSIDPNQSL